MARQKSEFVSAVGTAFEMIKLIAEEVYAFNGSDNDLRRILKEPRLRQDIAKLLVSGDGVVYPVEIMANSIAELVGRGNYEWYCRDINDRNFRVDPDHKAEIVLKNFPWMMTTKGVQGEMLKLGLRPATMCELLAFGAKYPDIQRQFPILALGSLWKSPTGYNLVGCLRRLIGERRLCLQMADLHWDSHWRFAAVRNNPILGQQS